MKKDYFDKQLNELKNFEKNIREKYSNDKENYKKKKMNLEKNIIKN